MNTLHTHLIECIYLVECNHVEPKKEVDSLARGSYKIKAGTSYSIAFNLAMKQVFFLADPANILSEVSEYLKPDMILDVRRHMEDR